MNKKFILFGIQLKKWCAMKIILIRSISKSILFQKLPNSMDLHIKVRFRVSIGTDRYWLSVGLANPDLALNFRGIFYIVSIFQDLLLTRSMELSVNNCLNAMLKSAMLILKTRCVKRDVSILQLPQRPLLVQPLLQPRLLQLLKLCRLVVNTASTQIPSTATQFLIVIINMIVLIMTPITIMV